jgi:hypothetical protein
MLRRTFRLHEALERRRFWVYRNSWNPLAGMQEAEFSAATGNFPDSFRWDTFCGCLYNGEDACATLFIDPNQRDYLVPAFEGDLMGTETIRRWSGRQITDLDAQDIDVLWLSPSVFISAVDFDLPDFSLPDDDGEPVHAHDYAVRLSRRGSYDDLTLYVYSFPFFEGNGFSAPSALPLQLLRHVTANLPYGYFSGLQLEASFDRIHERLPFECLVHFLDLVPFAPMTPLKQNYTTQLKVEARMNRDDVQEIFSRQFSPPVELSFSEHCSFDESVPLNVFLDLSRRAEHLRILNLPVYFFATNDKDLMDPRIVVDSMFKSPLLTLQPFGERKCIWEKFSHAMLHKIATGFRPNEIQIRVERPWLRQDFLRLCIQPFLQEDSILERFHIEVKSDVNESSATTITNCNSRELCFFDVSLVNGKGTRTSAHLELWDNVLFPRLSLNYCRKHLTQPVRGGVIPLATKAVNGGVVYSKTTGQAPFAMSTANAGLIFRFLKSEVATLQGCDMFPRFGRKRPSPTELKPCAIRRFFSKSPFGFFFHSSSGPILPQG